MKTFAIIFNSEVIDIITTDADVSEMFHPDIKYEDISTFQDRPSIGDKFIDGNFVKVSAEVNKPSRNDVDRQRLVSYADAVNGSDRHFMEMLSLQAEGMTATSAEVKQAKQRGLARKLEIQAMYPYPIE